MPRFARSLLLVVAWTLAGCASVGGPATYPSSWPAPDAGTLFECPALAGTYANAAAASDPQTPDPPTTLDAIFSRMGRSRGPASPNANGPRWAEAPGADSVRLAFDGIDLAVIFLADGQEAARLDFRRYRPGVVDKRLDDLFGCSTSSGGAGLLFLAPFDTHSVAIPYLFVEGGSTSVALHRARDGSLVVHLRSQSLTITSVGVGTAIRGSSVWWRFPPTLPP